MNTGTKTIVGTVAWLAFAAAARTSPSGSAWTHVLLTFAALVLVPLVLDLVSEKRDFGRIGQAFTWARRIQMPAAALLALACGMKPGALALLAAFPWVVFTALIGSAGFGRMMRDGFARPLDRLSADVGLAYGVIGGLWLLADRGGVRPMRFDPEVVALTAVHFHFAGLLLPIFGGRVLRQFPESRLAARGIVGAVLGVPSVAVGITIAQLGWTTAFEAAAGCGLALGGIVIAILHVRWALDARDDSGGVRALVGISGVSLFFAMVLAAAYAVRSFMTLLPGLGLPQMRAIHGTLNAIGFGFCGALGWWLVQRADKRANA